MQFAKCFAALVWCWRQHGLALWHTTCIGGAFLHRPPIMRLRTESLTKDDSKAFRAGVGTYAAWLRKANNTRIMRCTTDELNELRRVYLVLCMPATLRAAAVDECDKAEVRIMRRQALVPELGRAVHAQLELLGVMLKSS